MKKLIYLTCSIFSLNFLSAQQSVEELLQGYLQNSLELKKISGEVRQQMLLKESSEVSNGFSMQLSSGTVSIYGSDSMTVSFSPVFTAAFPKADNLSFSAATSVYINDDSSQKNISNTKLSLTADIYSGEMDKVKISLMEADRNYLEAQRNLQNGFLNVEKEFYISLKNLYEIAADIVKSEKSFYEDTLNFEKIKAQGYGSGSVTYRLAQSEVKSDEHKVQVNKHKLERETKIFASKCGVEYNYKNAIDFLPEKIPSVELVNVDSFKKENYVKIESAQWKKYINNLKRNSSKTHTLKGSAGYTFDNSKPGNGLKYEYYDTVDAGLSYTWNDTALTLSAGVSIPLDSSDPVYTARISFNPNRIILADIENQQNEENAKLEDIAIEDAESDYETVLISKRTAAADLLWNRESLEENYDMYATLEKDTAGYLARGIISESEYRSANVNKENYRIQLLINDIEKIIYSNETKILFTRDEELQK